MRRNGSILLLLGVSIGLGLLAAGRDQSAKGKPDFTGRWELNVNKSDFGKMPVPTRMTLEAKRVGNVLKAVQTSYDQAGGPNAVQGEWYLDGKDHPIGTEGKIIGSSRWDGDALVSERKSNDRTYVESIRMTLSSDGKTATEMIKTESPNGKNSSKLIWERK